MKAIAVAAAVAGFISSVSWAGEPAIPTSPPPVDCQAMLRPIVAAVKATDPSAALEATTALIALKGGPCSKEAEKAAEALRASASAAVPQAIDFLNSLAAKAEQAGKDLTASAKPLVDDAAARAAQAARDMAEQAKPLIDSASATATQAARDIADKAKPVVDEVKAKIDEATTPKPTD